MKTIAHTAGKWTVNKVIGHDNEVLHSKVDAYNKDKPTHTCVAMVQYDCDARLIAAAPELLEALEAAAAQLEEWRQVGYMKGWGLALRDAQAAITKARGEQ